MESARTIKWTKHSQPIDQRGLLSDVLMLVQNSDYEHRIIRILCFRGTLAASETKTRVYFHLQLSREVS